MSVVLTPEPTPEEFPVYRKPALGQSQAPSEPPVL